MTALKTRPPTGRVPWPLILVEGGEKVGKSWMSAELSGSPRVGATYWIDLGEGTADEYGAIPGARYELVEHDGSWGQILGSVAAVRDIAQTAAVANQPPVVLVIDSMTAEWDLLKAWAGSRAKGSKSNQDRLRKDPNAELDIPMNLWNDATARHRKLMDILMSFPGIAIMTARGKEVTDVDGNGRPLKTNVYKVEGNKALAYDASVWVRLSREQAPLLVGVRSVHYGIRPGVDRAQPRPDLSLDQLVFDVLKCSPETAQVREIPSVTPEGIRDEALGALVTTEELRALYAKAAEAALLDAVVTDNHNDDVPLRDLIVRIGKEKAEVAA